MSVCVCVDILSFFHIILWFKMEKFLFTLYPLLPQQPTLSFSLGIWSGLSLGLPSSSSELDKHHTSRIEISKKIWVQWYSRIEYYNIIQCGNLVYMVVLEVKRFLDIVVQLWDSVPRWAQLGKPNQQTLLTLNGVPSAFPRNTAELTKSLHPQAIIQEYTQTYHDKYTSFFYA